MSQDREPVSKDSLFNERAFKSWIANSVSNSDVEIYLAPAEAKNLLEGFQYLRETESWIRGGYDETPWFGYWWSWQNRNHRFVVDHIRKRAATSPSSSILKFWPSHKTMKEFLPVPEKAISIKGRHLDLEKWNEIAAREYDTIFGPGTFDAYRSNTLVAFRNGSLRPKLGHVQFEYRFDIDQNPWMQQSVKIFGSSAEFVGKYNRSRGVIVSGLALRSGSAKGLPPLPPRRRIEPQLG